MAGRTWFTSDTHFGHRRVSYFCRRPFLTAADREAVAAFEAANPPGTFGGPRISDESVAAMDDALIAGINAHVAEGDTLWHLGDWSMAPKSAWVSERAARQYADRCRAYRDRVRCRDVRVVWGNHDVPNFGDAFAEAHRLAEAEVDGRKVVLCHYAMVSWNGARRGSWHLYGHSHGEAEAWLDRAMPGRRSMDVGVDHAARLLGAYRPFSGDEVAALLGPRPGHHLHRDGGDGDA